MTRAFLIIASICLALVLGYALVAQEGGKAGDFRLNNGSTIKGNFDTKLLTLKSESDEKTTSYWVLPSNSVTSITRASEDQTKAEKSAFPRFTMKNEETRLLYARVANTILQKREAESAIVTKLEHDYDNPSPMSGVFLSFVTIDGKQESLAANILRGSLKDAYSYHFPNSSLRIRAADGQMLTISTEQLISFTR
ncbi:MAG: hypothetical protein ACMG6H_03410 [Acidobacteriota bacterium]